VIVAFDTGRKKSCGQTYFPSLKREKEVIIFMLKFGCVFMLLLNFPETLRCGFC
jgi:hypothetical protein